MAEGPASTCVCVFFRDTPECVSDAAAAVAGPITRLLSLGCRIRFVCAVSPEKRSAIFSRVMAEKPAIQFIFLPDTASKADAMHFALNSPTPEQYFAWFDNPTTLQAKTDARGWLFRAVRQLRVAELVGAVYRAPVEPRHCSWLQRQLLDFEFHCPKYVNCVTSNWLLAQRSDLLNWSWPKPDMTETDMDVFLGLWLHAKKMRVNHFRDDVQTTANNCGIEKHYVEDKIQLCSNN